MTASETDLRADGLTGSVVTIYERQDGEPAYPPSSRPTAPTACRSAGRRSPAPPPTRPPPAKLYVVTDSASAVGRILTVDATRTPGRDHGPPPPSPPGRCAGGAPRPRGHRRRLGRRLLLASEGNPEREKNPTVAARRVDARAPSSRVPSRGARHRRPASASRASP
ncbi:MAG: hypothetical protein M5U09_22310 [Gammaproteobacteria bacterium]|nr:hypothetical protein [Gammaproteobacteria bacterium]